MVEKRVSNTTEGRMLPRGAREVGFSAALLEVGNDGGV